MKPKQPKADIEINWTAIIILLFVTYLSTAGVIQTLDWLGVI